MDRRSFAVKMLALLLPLALFATGCVPEGTPTPAAGVATPTPGPTGGGPTPTPGPALDLEGYMPTAD